MQVDGTPGLGLRGIAGLGVVIRQPTGTVVGWHCAQAYAATCNEAEYQAVICGLTLALRRYPTTAIRCLSDSRVVVDQLSGRAAARADGLRVLYAQAVALAQRLVAVEFIHIPRALNRLADALAWEAREGRQQLGGWS